MKIVPLAHAAEVTLGRQRAPQYEVGEGQTRYLRSANITGDGISVADVKSMRFSAHERATFSLRSGDVLVTEGSGSRAMVGASAIWRDNLPGPVCFQNTVLRLRPRGGTDGRYLGWWARHAHTSGLMAAVASGANILHIGAEELRRLPMALPGLDEQRRIADFLDDQVSRLDAVVAEATRVRELAAVSAARRLQNLLGSPLTATQPLSSIASIVDTEHRTAPGDAGGGYWSAGTGSIRGGVLLRNRLLEIGADTYRDWTRREQPRPGDLLLTREAPIGEITMLGPDDNRIAIGQRVVLVKPSDQVLSEWLLLYFLSATFQETLRSLTQGSLHPHLNLADIARLRVPTPDLAVQARAVRISSQLLLLRDDAREASEALSTLASDRKGALIAASVAGELDVTSALLQSRP